MSSFAYTCPKCSHNDFVLDEMRGSSGGFMAYMNIDDQTVTMVVCRSCRFVELYRLSLGEFQRKHGIKGKDRY